MINDFSQTTQGQEFAMQQGNMGPMELQSTGLQTESKLVGPSLVGQTQTINSGL